MHKRTGKPVKVVRDGNEPMALADICPPDDAYKLAERRSDAVDAVLDAALSSELGRDAAGPVLHGPKRRAYLAKMLEADTMGLLHCVRYETSAGNWAWTEPLTIEQAEIAAGVRDPLGRPLPKFFALTPTGARRPLPPRDERGA